MDVEEKREVLRKVTRNLRFTEVQCTRVVKGDGSVFVGLTATFNDDPTLKEAEIAALFLGQRVDQLAYDRAVSDGVISGEEHELASRQTKINYNHKINERLDRGATPKAERFDIEEG
jgi:hypothetical protein